MEERRTLIDAWGAALNDIPMIRRARVGQRVRIGRSYESLTRLDFPYAAVLEFDDVDGLRAYLDHPAHEAMATQLFAVRRCRAINRGPRSSNKIAGSTRKRSPTSTPRASSAGQR